jgi:hypothetical protein
VTVGSWRVRTAAEQSDDIALVLGLARTQPDLFAVAGRYHLEGFANAVEPAAQPGKRRTVLLAGCSGRRELRVRRRQS